MQRGEMTDSDAGFELNPLAVRYLEHVRVEKRLASRTVELYAADLQKLQSNAQLAHAMLIEVNNTHMRRWVAQMHSTGRSPRGIALILSGWRGFYAWLGREGLVASNPVQGVRAPKVPKPLPKALASSARLSRTVTLVLAFAAASRRTASSDTAQPSRSSTERESSQPSLVR